MAKPKLTTKNLEILSELMLVEDLAYKKCNAYSKTLKDSALTECCDVIAQNHKARFTALYDYLNSHE